MELNRVGSATFELRALPFYPDAGEPQQLSFTICLVQSPVFAAGGYYWCVRMCPMDILHNVVINHFTTSLQLMSRGATGTTSRVRASYELSVIDTNAVLPPKSLFATPPRYFVSGGDYGSSLLSSSAALDLDGAFLQQQCIDYVRLGRLAFQCTVTVFPEEDPAAGASAAAWIDVPPSDMLGQLSEALEMGEGADVTFSVEGELFPAHKIVLAMRSPVFKAELFGEMRENGEAQTIVIDDIHAGTFRALLRYIYTDASPAAMTSNGDNEEEGDAEDDSSEDDDIRVWELLMAADRYGVQRLKLICERVLCKRLDVENVADTLALADQHHCDTIKDACIEFMTTSHRMGQVAATQGYLQLKSCHPHLVFEVLEKSSSFHKHVE